MIAILLYIAATRIRQSKWSEMLAYFASIGIGFLVPAVFVGTYFWLHGSLYEFWDSAFVYNFSYVATPELIDRLTSIYRAWVLLSTANLLWVGILGWSIVFGSLVIRSFPSERRHRSLLLLGLVSLPIELALASVSGRLINNHFISLLYMFSLFAAYFFHLVISGIRAWLSDLPGKKVIHVAMISFAVALPLTYVKPFNDYFEIIREYREVPTTTAELIALVEAHSSQHDTVLILPAESTINFVTQ